LRRHRTNLRTSSRQNHEQGVIITLVAVVMLGVVGAMAALSIDVVTLYTARSEAQLGADGAALAGARVLANSGLTSAAAGPANAENLARMVAKQVAANNQVGGRNLKPGTAQCTTGQEICVSFNDGDVSFATNPHVTVRVQRTDLPTFFARIWGSKQLTVAASATAEAYNPSGTDALGGPTTPVATTCVKPWLLPNMSPNPGPANPRIFDPVKGAILDTNLLGWETDPGTHLRADCTTCATSSTPNKWRYYPGDPADFPPPNASSVVCPGCVGFTPYQLSISGCVQTPISCNSTVSIGTASYPNRDVETATAVTGMTHSNADEGDSVDDAAAPSPPFQFLTGADNPVVLSGAVAAGRDVMVSDSLVTVPVINVDNTTPLPLAGFPSVQIIGFVQLFLNPTGQKVPGSNHIHTKVVNMAGCGTGATGQAILGNGASPVAVRLISPP